MLDLGESAMTSRSLRFRVGSLSGLLLANVAARVAALASVAAGTLLVARTAGAAGVGIYGSCPG
jgi:hypothetical protein